VVGHRARHRGDGATGATIFSWRATTRRA